MLSILIPVRNESNSLADLFNYFDKNLDGIDFEVIIINDFSDDDTLQKAKFLGQKNQKFKILNNTKKGLGGAINFGINHSTGEFLVIMMADQSDDIAAGNDDLAFFLFERTALGVGATFKF